MKEKFEEVGFNKKTHDLIEKVSSILQDYAKQGYRLTLRQLYYQLVSRDYIPNQVKEYNKLSRTVTRLRMGGYIDWDAIEDRLRIPKIPYSADDPSDALGDLISQYRLDRMENQDVYIEVWTEKDALSGIMERVTRKYHIRLVVNRGYSSASAMYSAMYRFKRQKDEGKECYVLYLGDHDPSGLDMDRDIDERLKKFFLYGVNVKRLALTSSQIERYNPPENPAKLSDPRAGWYTDEFGFSSWEVDALEPRVLTDLLTEEIEELIDLDKFNAKLVLEELHKDKLLDISENTDWGD